MGGDILFSFMRFLIIFLYIAPIIFIVWFSIKFLKIQKERNKILNSIADKLDKLGTFNKQDD
ncbi:hypothetical protein COK01_26935 [Priestia megaterium]|jgi:hypothetical protein|uniref:hypothetical protein n=1 Tax=Priestia megaterium TaxID=1404 RepID=UPI000BF2F44D|nr:hypothetical protein [Priestia megaterium]PEU67408.1 hypothetical protein CN397_26765 [Priestia megaterium]PFK69202.1 hypothetical protein COJ21_22770 [Priestia megaterium]PFP44722.1 hypothetical protein COK01_26935 [Priestia megaterium]